ncbi:MAG TPA: ATP-binding protein [Methylomirabilota bacterium]|nr:ATP-binding protein [Methylomirabilota bacterium]
MITLDTRVFRSKVARRTFVLFIVCALIPVSGLAILALGQVTAQLSEQSQRRLQQATKAVAMVIYKRLLALEASLTTTAGARGHGDVPVGLDGAGSAGDREPLFTSLALVAKTGRPVPLSGRVDRLPALTAEERHHLASGKTLLSLQDAPHGPPRLFLGRELAGPRPGWILWGEINSTYLWSFDDEPVLPSAMGLSVLDQAGRVVFSSTASLPAVREEVAVQMSRRTAGRFEWADDTNEYVASYWSLFLQAALATPKWTIVLSESKADVFAPIAAFKRTFVLVVLASVWVVLLLSIGQIRRSLIPLDKLQAGTRQIARGDFNTRVEIASGDEFEELASSLNRMAGQLGRQFTALMMSGEISAALGRNRELPAMLQECAETLVRHLEATWVRIWTLDSDETVLTLQAHAGEWDGADERQRRIPVGESVIGLIAADRRPRVMSPAPADGPRPDDQAGIGRDGAVAFVGHPLVVDGRLIGVAAAVTTAPLDEIGLRGFAAAAGEIAQCIERRRVEGALRMSEEQVRQLQKMEAVGRLAGGIAHDFNNLLTVITGHSQLLLRTLPPGDPLRGGLDLIDKTATRAGWLTRQLLVFSRKQVLEPAVVNLNHVVPAMAEMLQRLIGTSIDLVVTPGPNLGHVRVDPGQLEQVIVNLVVNARDAMPRGGQVTLETANVELSEAYAAGHVGVRPGPHVILVVSDTGVGMDAETRSHIFEPFFTTKAPGQGTGLGLATVYGIVKQSGGSIRVDSRLGEGTTFTIYFPRVDRAPAPAEVASPPPAGGNETVLVVEDEAEVRGLVRRVLEAHGYTVLDAGTVSEALRCAESHPEPIHLLVTDMVMPQMSGGDLAERLTSLRPEMAVLYMSGHTDHAVERTSFLKKPFTPDALAHKVRAVLDLRRGGELEGGRQPVLA